MQLPLLSTLHLSGNKLFGTIPPILESSKLNDLSLSNNHLTGIIPSSIQRHQFIDLDLSNRRYLSGDLPSSLFQSSSY
jgi:Leucine-rich repeat (LRR) protein